MDVAETMITRKAIYSPQKPNMERIIIMSNDSDVIGMAVCYGSTLLKNVPELGVQSAAETFSADT